MRLAILALILWLISLPALALEVTDDTGRKIILDQPAQRIITLAPHTTELTFAAGAESKLVGVVNYSDYPEAAKQLPRIGDATQLDRERILTLQPDLVIAWDSGNRPTDLEWLEKQGIPVYRSQPYRLEQIARNIEQIGKLTGNQNIAAKAASRFRQRHEALRSRYRRQETLTVFYQIWPQPLMTVNSDHIISQVLRLCGGENIFPELPTLAAQVNREAVILADPQVIVASSNDGTMQPLQQWQRWPSMQAVKNGHLFWVEADLIHRATPRILDGAEKICRDLATIPELQDMP
jgi:iron complex transport system substrate-binding protein